MNSKNFPILTSIAFGVLTLTFLIAFYTLAAWQEPTSAPPGGNVEVPINIGSVGQQKLFTSIGATTAGQLGISIPSGESFDTQYVLTAGTQTTYNAGLKGVKVAGDSLFEYGTTTISNLVVPSGGSITLNNESITSWSETGGESYWVQSGSNLYASDTSWSVGTGTTGPDSSYKLTVNSQGIKITNTGTQPSLYVEDESGDTTPFVIDANGKVGIGTTTPSSKLEVNAANGEKLRITTIPVGQTGSYTVNWNALEICQFGTCCPPWKDCDGDGHTYMDGTDCDEGCSECYVGSDKFTYTPDGRDQNCDGVVDDGPYTTSTTCTWEFNTRKAQLEEACKAWCSAKGYTFDKVICSLEFGGLATDFDISWDACWQNAAGTTEVTTHCAGGEGYPNTCKCSDYWR